MNFDIKTEQLSDDAYVISLAGEVDLYTAPEFKQQLLEVIGQGGKEVVVDFSGTTFIDSTTLGVLVGGVKRLRSNDGQLSLVCSDRNITKIFEITGLDRVFTIYPTRDEAVSSLGAARAARRAGSRVAGAGLAAIVARCCSRGCGTGGGRRRRPTPTRRTARSSSRGRRCGGCHMLAAAGTSGTIGPNLDDAFAGDRAQGFKQSTIENVVLDQIRLGSGIATPTSRPPMPNDTSSQAARTRRRRRGYVAAVAGTGSADLEAGFAQLGHGRQGDLQGGAARAATR